MPKYVVKGLTTGGRGGLWLAGHGMCHEYPVGHRGNKGQKCSSRGTWQSKAYTRQGKALKRAYARERRKAAGLRTSYKKKAAIGAAILKALPGIPGTPSSRNPGNGLSLYAGGMKRAATAGHLHAYESYARKKSRY